jgi:hypothetical protein
MIRKRADKCWFRAGQVRITRSYVLLPERKVKRSQNGSVRRKACASSWLTPVGEEANLFGVRDCRREINKQTNKESLQSSISILYI